MYIQDIIKQRILVLDGAMGTMIQGYGLGEDDFRGERFRDATIQMKGNNDMLNLTRPDIIADIHRRYLEAGADIISTNTFSSQRVSEADYGLQDFAREMALEGARIARREADRFSTERKPRFVCGSMGPTNKTCSLSPDVSNPAMRDLDYDQLYTAYVEQADALLEGGVDALLIETIFDTLNAKAAVDASLKAMADRGRTVPVMLSLTVSDKAGRTLSGQTIDAFLVSMAGYPLFSVGLNCSFGAADLKPFLHELSMKSPFYVTVHPNAGLPNSLGQYDDTPEHMAEEIGHFIDEGLVNIVGGCCGTTDEYIARFVPLAAGRAPRLPRPRPACLSLSGLEALHCTPETGFVNVGERCNVAGSRKFLRLVKEHQYEEALSIARKQVEDGALVIDVNMDDGLLDARQEMVTFLNMIAVDPDIARVPVMIDSSRWDVILAGLKCLQGKCIVNSISLKEGEHVFVGHARDVKRFGAAVVVMCFDEQGQATTFERRKEIASRAYRILTEQVGMNPLDIIFDPNVLAVATGMEEHDDYAADFIRSTRWIRQHLPGVHVSGGVSNLSFSFRGNNYIREAMHAVFLYHAIASGMDFGIVNPASKVTYADIPADRLQVIEDVILNRKPGAAEALTDLANGLKEAEQKARESENGGAAGGQATAQPEWRQHTVEERLRYAIIKGMTEYLQEDLDEALAHTGHAVSIIEGPLMDGMRTVGEYFGNGKMFLPQVVKTARVMKKAVEILQPHIENERQEGAATAGKVVLATVKGDVHDIGKNIVAVIMQCNNYEVIDLGVMVPAEQIVETVIRERADMVGLSGLITPSLDEMVHVAQCMDRAGLDIPIMIGGATTSKLHVALKIAPVYGGTVVWMKDAAQNVLAAACLMDGKGREEMQKELAAEYETMRRDFEAGQKDRLLSLDEARDRKIDLF